VQLGGVVLGVQNHGGYSAIGQKKIQITGNAIDLDVDVL